ncbi:MULTISPECIES: DUF349 domain-containing protein [unclassified Massilia]|uniref:DUF349 domain-containing protein n=1 Tax=unclassified Massilia TaxID=2609279 RepID=UPI001B83D518|nr:MULTISPECIES: DUF349 domain-containing protein [unclassified Massilia]MBQ5941654.1 DUF349 domain-containing protein [Massilia sp. AB1]MBQ5962555.1 DUF349 domain-containing protein [Massilia sp. ZL223]
MFEFLFKRQGGDKSTAGPDAAAPGGQPSGKASGQGASHGPAPGGQGGPNTSREQQAEQLRQLNGDEAAAVEFLLRSEFSELRLAAAELVHSREQLERVHAAMRNTDRRVAKLTQSRLDAIRHHEAELRRGQEALAQARALLGDHLLTPNHVAELDRKWAITKAPELAPEFDAVRAELAQRLEAQVQLQRAMIDRLAALRQLDGAGLDAGALSERLASLQHEQEAALVAPEHASLPRALVAEFASEHARLTAGLATIEQDQAALAAREAALNDWQGKPQAELKPEQLRKDWNRLPALPANAAGAQLQQRFDALLAALPQEVRKPKPEPSAAKPAKPQQAGAPSAQDRKPARGADQQFIDNMDALEAALQQGSLHSAAELDKALKDSKDKGMRLSPAQADRLGQLRAELKRLSDWARWGGNVSREELIKTVEALPTQNLAMSELAKKVGSMRDRWKALDSLSGAAPRSLWERFDAACTAAYAPAAAHFRQLADERHANAARGQALVEEAQAEIARLQSGEADWKHVSGTVQRLRMAWSHLGAIDRKDKKRLDQLFSEALTTLQKPLETQRQVEMGVREQLIEEAQALDPHDRHAVDLLRELQHRWQEHARALPLERKAEQALWQRFRAACDALFAARKEHVHAADSERRAHEAAKEALCARLEAAAPEATPATAGKLVREAAAEWQAIGPVPRAHEARIEKRYHAAVAQVQHHADVARRAAGLALAGAVRDKLRLIQALENALVNPDAHTHAADWRQRWEAMLPLEGPYESLLHARFEAALAALDGERAGYARQLEANRERVQHELLKLEIAAGIDSGPEFARERLKLQVEVLQNSLKSGQKPGAQGDALRQLLSVPALADARTETRIEQLLMRQAKEGK